MERIKKVNFHVLVKKWDWLQLDEGKTRDGYAMEIYLTPAGRVIFIIYDNDECIKTTAMPTPPPPAVNPRPVQPLDLSGLGIPPFGKG